MRLVLVGAFLFMSGCITASPPVDQYALAREAIDSARAVDAGRYSPGFFHSAQEKYRNAQQFYESRDYSKARDYFDQARDLAERAENSARLIRHQTGEIL